MKKIFICDDVNSLPQSSCKTILWNSSPLASNHLSISEIIESNAKILRTTYLAHIHDLGLLKIKNNTVINLLKIDKDLSFWWLTLFSQKCNFIKSENIDNIIKFMAFELWADTNTFTAIELRTNNKNLYLCLKTWCNKKNIDEVQLKILEIALDCINNDNDISILKSQFETKLLNQSGLLSIKPKIFVCNVDEQSVRKGNEYTKSFNIYSIQ